MPRGKWLITRRAVPFDSFSPVHSLFVDGILRVAYAVNQKYGHAMVWTYPYGIYSDGATQSVMTDGEESARKLCLEYACLTESQVTPESPLPAETPTTTDEIVPTDPTVGIPDSFLRWEE